MTEYNHNYSFGPEQPKIPKKKKQVSLTTAILVSALVSVIVFTLCGGAGYLILSNMQSDNDTNKSSVKSESDGSAVIYRDVTLRDQNGNAVKGQLTVGEVADAAKDSVVEITTEALSTGQFMMQYVAEGAGSGVIITEDGYIVTNNHVIEGATSISVRTTDGKTHKAKLIGTDARTDLAVIKIEQKGLKSAIVGDFKKCKLGDTVVAIGNPLGQLGGTVTDGIISALDREITIDDNIMTLIQTNTAINPGNSGGGLFNTSGQLIGIVNAKSSGEDVEGLGFAIPIDLAQEVIEDLIEYGYVKGRIDTGIEVLEISDFQSAMYYRVQTAGLYVYSVTKNSDSEKSGFEPGDLIKSIDGTALTTDDEYYKIIESHKIGDKLEFVVMRKNKEIKLTMTLIEYKPN